jgi:hypothetical protein
MTPVGLVVVNSAFSGNEIVRQNFSNSAYHGAVVWSWVYKDREFILAPLGSLPPPPGAGGVAESDIVQLWSLTFLAVIRNEGMRSR